MNDCHTSNNRTMVSPWHVAWHGKRVTVALAAPVHVVPQPRGARAATNARMLSRVGRDNALTVTRLREWKRRNAHRLVYRAVKHYIVFWRDDFPGLRSLSYAEPLPSSPLGSPNLFRGGLGCFR